MFQNFKNTPLHWCVTSKCIKGVEILLNQGANVLLINKLGKTPMQLAETTCLDIFYVLDKVNYLFSVNSNLCINYIIYILVGCIIQIIRQICIIFIV